MRKLNCWVPNRELKWHTRVRPSIHLPPPPPPPSNPPSGEGHKERAWTQFVSTVLHIFSQVPEIPSWL